MQQVEGNTCPDAWTEDIEYIRHELPISKLEVYNATKYFKYIDEAFSAVEPDVVVENRFSEFEQGIDPIYECVRSFDDE